MTVLPMRKLALIPVLMGLFFLFFVSAAYGLLFQRGASSPMLALSVVGMAITGVMAMKRLVLRGREAEEALSEGELYIEAVAELSQDVHVIIDTRSRAFLYLNPAVESLLGYSQAAFIKGGLDFFYSLIHPDDLLVLQAQNDRIMGLPAHPLKADEAESVQEQVFRIRNHHGDYRWFRSRRNVFVRYPDGHPAEILAVVQDITEQRSYETAVVQAQKMESLGALTRGSVHDLNNTLMGIQGFADMALESATDAQALQRHLEKLQVSIQRASALCRQVLAYTGQGRIQISPNQLNNAVKDSLSAIENLVPQGVVLMLELDSTLPLASLDLGQVRSALLNLVYNAAESVRVQGGEITIRTYVKLLDGQQPSLPGLAGSFACVEVRDSGTSKPPEVLAKLCDPLFGTLHPGFGLGLSAVQGIVNEHQGGLEAVSLPEVGGATVLYFPLAQISPEIDEGDEGTPLVGAAGVVLVVDDEPSIRSILRSGLESAGFKVIEAEDGVDGFGAFVRHRSSISAVLLDLTMPRMGGDEVFEEIHKLAPEVPVILMSGYSEEEATAALSSKGLGGFLSKPCSMKDAVAVVHKALAGH